MSRRSATTRNERQILAGLELRHAPAGASGSNGFRNDMNDADRFNEMLSRIVGKRLTYAELTGKIDERPTEEEVEPF